MTPEQIDARVAHFKAELQRAGVRLTPQRAAIVREVLAGGGHPDADSVFARVRERVPEVSLDTVYRTLWKLTELGLLTLVGPRQPRVRFDANPEPHHHFVCLRCGETRDFEGPQVDLEPLRLRTAGLGTLASAQVEARGLCARCAGEGDPR